MTARKRATKTEWVDSDDIPELSDEWFDKADLMIGDKVIRKGRPPGDNNKVSVTIRLSPEVVDYYRSTGAGWQTRLDEHLVRHVRREKKPAAVVRSGAAPRSGGKFGVYKIEGTEKHQVTEIAKRGRAAGAARAVVKRKPERRKSP